MRQQQPLRSLAWQGGASGSRWAHLLPSPHLLRTRRPPTLVHAPLPLAATTRWLYLCVRPAVLSARAQQIMPAMQAEPLTQVRDMMLRDMTRANPCLQGRSLHCALPGRASRASTQARTASHVGVPLLLRIACPCLPPRA